MAKSSLHDQYFRILHIQLSLVPVEPIDRLLCPDIVHFHCACLRYDRSSFTGAGTFKHAEFKTEEFPFRRPAVFSQTPILCSLISRQFFSLFNDTH